jgi:hypothetical protein
MGRIRDLGWWFRERAAGFALLLALLGCGAGAAGIVIALDAKDTAESAAATAVTAPATPAVPPADADLQGTVDELNERVAAIEESVSSLREETGTGTTTTETTTPDDSGSNESATPPDIPELPEGIEIPGVGEPEAGAPAP